MNVSLKHLKMEFVRTD